MVRGMALARQGRWVWVDSRITLMECLYRRAKDCAIRFARTPFGHQNSVEIAFFFAPQCHLVCHSEIYFVRGACLALEY